MAIIALRHAMAELVLPDTFPARDPADTVAARKFAGSILRLDLSPHRSMHNNVLPSL